MYLLMKNIILTIFNDIPKIVESRRKPSHRSVHMVTPPPPPLPPLGGSFITNAICIGYERTSRCMHIDYLHSRCNITS